MHRRLVAPALLIALLLAVPGAASAKIGDAKRLPFFGKPVPPVGTEMRNVVLTKDPVTGDPAAVAKLITIDANVDGNITASVSLRGAKGNTVDATLTWQDKCRWQLTIAAGGFSGPTPANRTAVNLDQLSGQIRNMGCGIHADLVLSGYTLGNATFDVEMHLVEKGFEGTAEIRNLVLGGTTFPRARVTVSTLTPKVRLEGIMQTSVGTFTTDSWVSAPNGNYEIELNVTGADLQFKTPTFEVTAFRFSANARIPASGDAQYAVRKGSAGGTLVMKKTTYTLDDISVKMVGSEVTEFRFAIEIRHETSPSEIYTGKLFLSLDADGGTFEELSQGRNSNGAQLVSETKTYARALLGTVDISKTREFNKKYAGKRMKRSVTIGLVFGVSVYQTRAGSAYNTYVGAGGYFDADRVSGGFGCVFGSESSDFSCLGTIRVNPRWAGVYRYQWEV